MTDLVNQPNKMNEGFNTAGGAIEQGKTVEQIQTKYHTAVRVQKPRDLAVVEKSCLMEATLAGEACFYGWGSGKDRVEGPSIDCAMIAARNWGNAAVEPRPMIETPTAYIFEEAFIDFETGFTYSRQFRQSKKSIVYGRMDDERKDNNRFQQGQSKAQRNTILKALPAWLINKMMDKAKAGVRKKLEEYAKNNGIEKARKLSADTLSKMGVPTSRVEAKYGKKYGAWDIDMLVILRGDITALTSGAESADALFPDPDKEEKPEKTNGLSADDMKPGDSATHQGHEDQGKPGQQTEAGF